MNLKKPISLLVRVFLILFAVQILVPDAFCEDYSILQKNQDWKRWLNNLKTMNSQDNSQNTIRTLEGLERLSTTYDKKKKKDVLRILCPKGTVGSPEKAGAMILENIPPTEKAMLSFEVKFPKEVDFVKAGKLAGLVGGLDGATSTISGGKNADGSNGFSVRTIWRNQGSFVCDNQNIGLPRLYSYHMDDGDLQSHKSYCHLCPKDCDKCKEICDLKGWKWGEYQDLPPEYHFTPGVWHRVTMEVGLNQPEVCNYKTFKKREQVRKKNRKKDPTLSQYGKIRVWFEADSSAEKPVFADDIAKSKPTAEFDGLCFRSIPDIKINGVTLETFFGGDEPDWATTKDEYIEFDNIKIISEAASTN